MKKIFLVIMIIVFAMSGCAVSTDSAGLTPAPTVVPTATPTAAPTVEPTAELTPTPRDPNVIDHIILSVVYVTKEWSPFTDISGWTQAVPVRESQGVKFYEAAIWEDTMSIHLYAFPNDFEPWYGSIPGENVSDEEKVAYRESFLVKAFSGMPSDHAKRGPFVLGAFSEFAKILVERHPDATHNLIYSGHGMPGGELFEAHLMPQDANAFLGNWHAALGRKLGFVDMGTVCTKGSFQDLEAFYEHTDYYIASDVLVCSIFDEGADMTKSDPLYQYPYILSSNDTIEKALIERINLNRLRYEDSINDLTERQLIQSQYLYSCSAFGEHRDAIASFIQSLNYDPYKIASVDLRSALEENGAGSELLAAFDSIIIQSVDTKDFITLLQSHNGMLWVTSELDYFAQ
jgi:hypothetical protein